VPAGGQHSTGAITMTRSVLNAHNPPEIAVSAQSAGISNLQQIG
jgi:hypothetical protein